MTRESVLAAICFLIAVVPFAGIPGAWKLYATTLLGTIAGFLALAIRSRVQRLKKKNGKMQDLVSKFHEGDTPHNPSRATHVRETVREDFRQKFLEQNREKSRQF